MPGIDGWECLREIKQLMAAHHVPIVMCSSADLLSLGYNPSDVGATAFMKKADSIAGLQKNLTSLLQQLFPEWIPSPQYTTAWPPLPGYDGP